MQPKPDGQWSYVLGFWILLAACLLLPQPGHADPERGAVLLDKPVSVQKIDPQPSPGKPDALTCTYYADLMIRETGTDSPGTGPAYVVHFPAAGKRPQCTAPRVAGDMELKTSNEAMLGRKGQFLFFEMTDAQGASPFEVVRITDGKSVYSDISGPDLSIKSINVTGDAVIFTYNRGYNASCSIPKDGDKCWKRLVKEGRFNIAIASQPAPIDACKLAYTASKTPDSDTSLITYDVTVSIPPEGKATVLARGKTGCEPGP